MIKVAISHDMATFIVFSKCFLQDRKKFVNFAHVFGIGSFFHQKIGIILYKVTDPPRIYMLVNRLIIS